MKSVFFMERYTPILKEVFEKNGYRVTEGDLNKEAAKADIIFSINYEPKGAEYCFRNNKKYASWIVDCPHTVLYHKTFHYESNYIFLFDYNLYCQMLEREPVPNLYYLPLAADAAGFQKAIQNAQGDIKPYQSDVSFVGRLYRDEEHALFDKIEYLPPYVRGYLDSLMHIQRKMWGVDILKESISNQVWEQLEKYVKWNLKDEYEDHYKETMLNILHQKVAQQERMEMCSMLAKEFDFALYTGDTTEFDPNIINRGYVDYLKEMPLVFANSKININLTIRSISSGIPLRCLDIVACGGFLLTNYQMEIAEYFVDGKEVVIYTDFQDMKEKIRYYLEHEDERRCIAERGREKAVAEFSYEKQIGKMLAALEGK